MPFYGLQLQIQDRVICQKILLSQAKALPPMVSAVTEDRQRNFESVLKLPEIHQREHISRNHPLRDCYCLQDLDRQAISEKLK